MMRRRFMNSSNSVPLSFEALEDGLSISFSNEILYCINGGTWVTLLAGENTEEVNKGSVVSFRHSKSIRGDGSIGTFSINKKCNVFGACPSVIPKVLGEKYMTQHLFHVLFYGCNTIVDASKLELPATTLANYCYYDMFSDCTSLVKAPALPATTLAENCYNSMFNGCTSLTTAPALPATTLASGCYNSMFNGCTSLTTAPALPATTLASGCYKGMFNGCTSLTTAPALPATTLTTSCYSSMFYGCKNLNYIKMLATDISASGCLKSWVFYVATTGTFVKNPAMNSLPTGRDGILEGWTVVNDGEESGGGKIVNHGVLKLMSKNNYKIYWEYPVESQITTVVVGAAPIGTVRQNVITTIGNDVSSSNYSLGPGGSISHIESVTPTEDDTYIYEVTIE